MSGNAFALVIMGIVFAVFGIVVGFHIGGELGEKAPDKKTYWKYNAIAYVVGIVASAFIWATGWVMVSFVTIGGLGGCIAGLKMGYGESVGPWAAHDRFFNRTNRRRPKRAKKADKGAGWAQRKPEGEPESDEPELMSVADPGAPQDRKHRRG